jgi:hypothetical protein
LSSVGAKGAESGGKERQVPYSRAASLSGWDSHCAFKACTSDSAGLLGTMILGVFSRRTLRFLLLITLSLCTYVRADIDPIVIKVWEPSMKTAWKNLF